MAEDSRVDCLLIGESFLCPKAIDSLCSTRSCLFDLLEFRLLSQMGLVRFPAGTPTGVPAPEPRHQGFGIGFSFFPVGAGFTGECLLCGRRTIGFHGFFLS